MKNNRLLIVAGAMFALIHNTALAALPYVFTPGGTIRATEINANNAYLEDLINSSAQPQPTQLIKTVLTNGTPSGAAVAVYAVPSGATRPYLIRQIISPSSCSMYISGYAFNINGLMTNLTIPVNASETVSLSGCSGGNVLVILSQ